jgi:hypothetical protein
MMKTPQLFCLWQLFLRIVQSPKSKVQSRVLDFGLWTLDFGLILLSLEAQRPAIGGEVDGGVALAVSADHLPG